MNGYHSRLEKSQIWEKTVISYKMKQFQRKKIEYFLQ